MTGSLLTGVGGRLFPLRYLSDRLWLDTGPIDDADVTRHQGQLVRWWQRIAATCGPATGSRTLFDVAAMPLFARLGFRASRATFERDFVRATLTTRGGTAVALLQLNWASKPSAVWRHAVEAAGDAGADWCFVLAPPFLSLVAARGQAVRRSADFFFPDALAPATLPAFLALVRSEMFDRSDRDGAPIEALVNAAAVFQDRVRSDLQEGVIEALGSLRSVIRDPRATTAVSDTGFDEALTIVYRILFLLFAEARDLVPRHHPIYRDVYALGTLCRDAREHGMPGGLWEGLAAVTRLSRTGCRVDDLIVRPFNGRLFARRAAPSLEAGRPGRRPSRLMATRDAALSRSLKALAMRRTSAGHEEICYADLGVEQLGAVYERVLDLEPADLVPPIDGSSVTHPARPRRGGARRAPHSERRKQSGSFYTPQDLAEFIVRRTLAPLVAGCSPEAILSLRVVDPAMGSGAFLVAACRYLGAAYERALVDEGRCGAGDVGPADRVAMRRLIAERCLAGVDINPVAVQVARLSLWLATLAEGKPLGFLDHRLRTGNSLVGAAPEDLRRTAVRAHRAASLPLFDDIDLQQSLRAVTRPLRELSSRGDETVEDVRVKEAVWNRLSSRRSPLAPWRHAASLWCARWFWSEGRPPAAPELRAAIDALLKGDTTLHTPAVVRWLSMSAALESSHGFFHWPLEFADVFYDDAGRPRDRPGFDAVIGNPPWEMLRRESGTRPTRILNRPLVRFIRESGLYSSCDRGHVNLYQPFLERALWLARPGGRIGMVLPWGLAVDDGASALRARMLDHSSLDTIVGLDNAGAIFPIHRGLRFLVVVASPGRPTGEWRARFGVKTREEIAQLPDALDNRGGDAGYPIRLSRGLLEEVTGTARRIPDVRRRGDLELLEHLTSAHPRLGSADGWRAEFGRELNATDDRACLGSIGLPVLEGKHIQPFAVDVSAATCRIDPEVARQRIRSGSFAHDRLAYRDVSGVSNRLSLIAAIIPAETATTHTLFCLRSRVPIEQQYFLCGLFNSYVLNAFVRLLMGGHLTTTLIENLPVPRWSGSAAQRRIARLAHRLSRAPRQKEIYALLQAAVARLYQLTPAVFSDVLSGFPLVPAPDRQRTRLAFEGRGRGADP